MRGLKAGIAYFAIVFAIGIVLGTARTLLMASFPDVGRFRAVLLEGPLILTASWLVCRILVRALAVAGDLRERAIMGASAFGLLMVAEAAMGMSLAGESFAAHFALYAEPAYALGLAGQAGFGLMPLFAGDGRRRPPQPTRPVT